MSRIAKALVLASLIFIFLTALGLAIIAHTVPIFWPLIGLLLALVAPFIALLVFIIVLFWWC